MSEALRKAAEQALAALKTSIEFANHMGVGGWQPTAMQCHEAVASLKAALAEPEQSEPVAVFYRCNNCGHAYEGEPPTQCDCMEGTGFDRVEYFAHPQRREPEQSEPACYQYQDRDGQWCNFVSEKHYEDTKLDGNWPIRALYTAPPRREPLSDEQILSMPSLPDAKQLDWDLYGVMDDDNLRFARAIEQAHGITGEKT
jgi:hypothetical protein